MTLTAAQLLVKVSADTAPAQAGLAGLTAGMGGVGIGALAVVGAVGAIGIASTVMAGNFQQNMVQLVTGAGESQKNIKMVSDGILQMAVDTGTSTNQLSAGMYMIESAGYHGADALNILKAAAEGAKVGNADLGTVSDALTTVLKDYPNAAGGAAGAMNLLISTVANGKTHMQDLSLALSQVLPTASAAGIGLNDVMAAMSTMTGEGIHADDAATHLRQLLISLDAPSKQAKDALLAVGLSSDQVAQEAKTNLPAALKEITDRLAAVYGEGSPKYVAALKDISGGSKQMQGIVDLTGPHMKDFENNLNSVTGAVKDGGAQITGWNLVQGTFNQHLDVAREKVEVMMIGLGQHLLPVVQGLVDAIANKVVPALEHFASWITGNSQSIQQWRPVLIAVGIAIGGALVAAFAAWAYSAAAAAVATIAAMWPVLAIGAAIALLVAGIIILVQHWADVTTALGHFKDMLGNVLGAIGNFVGAGLGDIGGFIGSVLGWFGNLFGTILGAAGSFVGNFLGLIGSFKDKAINAWLALGQGIAHAIEAGIKAGIDLIITEINGLIYLLDAIQIHIPSIGVGPVQTPAFDWNGLGIPKIPMLAQGGTVGIGGAAIVGEAGMELLTVGGSGAKVTPLTSGGGAAGSAGAGQPMTLVLQVDGRTLAQIVTKYQPGVIRQSLGVRAF